MKNRFYKYYLTKSTREDILAGNGEFWEEEDDGWQVFTQNINLAKSWDTKEDLLKDIKKSKYKIALFINDTFSEFLDY